MCKSKIVFKSYNQNAYLLFPPCLGDLIPENAPVRVLNSIVDDLFTQVVEMLVEAEFATVAIAHNIKKMVSLNGCREAK